MTTVRVANGLGGVGGIDRRTAVGACRAVAFTYGPGIEPPAADLGFDPNAPLLPLPEAAVSPSTNLAVGQQVTVSGRWFTSADTVEIVQCADRWLLTPVACDDATAVTTTTDDLGRAAATFTLQRSLTLRDGTAVDCTVEDCAVLVRNPDVFGEVAWVPIGMLAPTASGPTAPRRRSSARTSPAERPRRVGQASAGQRCQKHRSRRRPGLHRPQAPSAARRLCSVQRSTSGVPTRHTVWRMPPSWTV